MYGYIIWYFIFCVSFAAGMFVGEYKHKEVSKSTMFLYIAFTAIAAPVIFFALLGEFLIVQSKSRPTPNAADALPCGHSMGTVESDNYIVCCVCGRHVRR